DISEAECMYRWLVARGIDANRLLLEDRALSTEENLFYSELLIDEHHLSREIAIVTHDFHEYRAAGYAREVGLTPYAVPAKNSWWLFPTFYVRELYGVLDLWFF
ncbi:MAG TPA: YdcF family protein, partial [Clostridiaceae bacterium]|nr:YdcF family protein [Clostridiaceae bacterium]